jgi:cell wall-associated NlpC family hydrolase
MEDLDPRLHAYRPDLAAASLRGRVRAAAFTAGRPMQLRRGAVALRRFPSAKAPQDSQLLAGETVILYDSNDGWAWVQNDADGYVGYVEAAALSDEIRPASHWVSALRSFVYPDPDMKSVPFDHLPMTAEVTLVDEEDAFARLADGGWVYGSHLSPLAARQPDYVATAERFLGTPYLWGGKESLGLDCSGLVQVALAAAGIRVPRDCDHQEAALGAALPWRCARETPPARGDLLYSPGHVAIALEGARVLHATAHAMAVVTEDLAVLEARLRAHGGPGFTGRRRPL